MYKHTHGIARGGRSLSLRKINRVRSAKSKIIFQARFKNKSRAVCGPFYCAHALLPRSRNNNDNNNRNNEKPLCVHGVLNTVEMNYYYRYTTHSSQGRPTKILFR